MYNVHCIYQIFSIVKILQRLQDEYKLKTFEKTKQVELTRLLKSSFQLQAYKIRTYTIEANTWIHVYYVS